MDLDEYDRQQFELWFEGRFGKDEGVSRYAKKLYLVPAFIAGMEWANTLHQEEMEDMAAERDLSDE